MNYYNLIAGTLRKPKETAIPSITTPKGRKIKKKKFQGSRLTDQTSLGDSFDPIDEHMKISENSNLVANQRQPPAKKKLFKPIAKAPFEKYSFDIKKVDEDKGKNVNSLTTDVAHAMEIPDSGEKNCDFQSSIPEYVGHFVEIQTSNDNKPQVINVETLQPENYINYQSLKNSKNVAPQFSPAKISRIEYRSVASQTPSTNLGLYDICMFENDDEGLHFYTGLESYKKFKFVYSTLVDYVPFIQYRDFRVLNVSAENQFFLTLMKLRRNAADFELSRFFGVSKSTVSNIFCTWINVIAQLWSNIDVWPSREFVNFYIPQGFKEEYPQTRIIFDATEIPISKPSNVRDQQCTFSYYKHRNTAKELVGSSPGGLFTYCSPAYAGSTSDRQIFENEEVVKKFDKDDSVMADRGFNVQDICATKDVKVNIPHFLRGDSQLPGVTVLQDRKLFSKRVHIERLIGLVKTYKILEHPLSPSHISLTTKIFQICLMLCNFREGIISKNA